MRFSKKMRKIFKKTYNARDDEEIVTPKPTEEKNSLVALKLKREILKDIEYFLFAKHL